MLKYKIFQFVCSFVIRKFVCNTTLWIVEILRETQLWDGYTKPSYLNRLSHSLIVAIKTFNHRISMHQKWYAHASTLAGNFASRKTQTFAAFVDLNF